MNEKMTQFIKGFIKRKIGKSSGKAGSRSFGLAEQIFFSERLDLLLNSGISTVESLVIMNAMENSPKRKAVYGLMIEQIERGLSLGKVIRNEKIKFNSLLVMLIQNGEISGNLAAALSQACAFLVKRNEMKKKIIGSLVYPFFIVIFTVLMTLFLILYIFPKIIPLLKSLNITLPLMTRIVQGLYYFLMDYGLYILIAGMLLSFIFYISIQKSAPLRYKIDVLCLSTPLFGRYLKIYSISHVCYMSEMLLSSGRSLADILNLSKEYSANLAYRKVFGEVHKDLIKGISLSISLKSHMRFFPDLLPHMCELGERTGNLAVMFRNCGDIFEADIDNALKKFTLLIEPSLMVFMGLLVGSIALSIILPIYEITNHLGK